MTQNYPSSTRQDLFFKLNKYVSFFVLFDNQITFKTSTEIKNTNFYSLNLQNIISLSLRQCDNQNLEKQKLYKTVRKLEKLKLYMKEKTKVFWPCVVNNTVTNEHMKNI